MDERNLVAVSIKHTIHGWKFGMPCWLWGSRTNDEEKRSFSVYTEYPNNAEVYSLKEWQESGYGADGNRKFYIECLRCHRRGKTKMFEFRAIRAWNRRADNGGA